MKRVIGGCLVWGAVAWGCGDPNVENPFSPPDGAVAPGTGTIDPGGTLGELSETGDHPSVPPPSGSSTDPTPTPTTLGGDESTSGGVDPTGLPGTTIDPVATTSTTGDPGGDSSPVTVGAGESTGTMPVGDDTMVNGTCSEIVPGSGACPPECTSCEGGVCLIDCTQATACSGGVVCPPDWPCDIECGDNACGHTTITCSSKVCNLACNGINACINSHMICGEQACSVTCGPSAAALANFECMACDCTDAC